MPSIIPSTLNNLVAQRIMELPEPWQKILRISPWESELDRIARQLKLKGRDRDILATEVIMVITGTASRDSFLHELTTRLNLDPAYAQKAHLEITRSIFAPIFRELDPYFQAEEQLYTTMQSSLVTSPTTEPVQPATTGTGSIIENTDQDPPTLVILDEDGDGIEDAIPLAQTIFRESDSPETPQQDVESKSRTQKTPSYTAHDPYHEPIE